MKRIYLFTLIILGSQSMSSQAFEALILAADDASSLGHSYISPGVRGLMYSMNGGWFTTAKTHKMFGFDLSINANAAFSPRNLESFTFTESSYTFLSLPNGETTLNTVMSNGNPRTEVDIRIPVGDGTFKVASFEMPGGIADELPLNAIPSPTVQLGIGLPFNTDLKIRFIPTLTFDNDLEADLVGIGLQHDISKYFGIPDQSSFNLALLAAFTTMKVNYNITGNNNNNVIVLNNTNAKFKMNTYIIQAITSIDFRTLSFYGGVGYNSGTSTARMLGEYGLTYDVEDSEGNVVGTVSETVTDPVNLKFRMSGMRATIGARLNIGFFKIFADYTIQEFNTTSAGIAFSFN